jgi:hypothetical protein
MQEINTFGESLLRRLTYLWTVLFLSFIFLNFFSANSFEYLVAPLSVLYTGLLVIYVGTKEFDRWFEFHSKEKHPGEAFVWAWTAVMAFVVIGGIVMGEGYHVDSDIVSTYIGVLTVYAITARSKRLFGAKTTAQAGRSNVLGEPASPEIFPEKILRKIDLKKKYPTKKAGTRKV